MNVAQTALLNVGYRCKYIYEVLVRFTNAETHLFDCVGRDLRNHFRWQSSMVVNNVKINKRDYALEEMKLVQVVTR